MGRKATGRNPINFGSAAGLLSDISTSAEFVSPSNKFLPRGSAFSTELDYTVPVTNPNSAPDTPATPTGQSNGYMQTIYSYDTSGTDPDGDLLTYRFDWGDGSTSAWGGA